MKYMRRIYKNRLIVNLSWVAGFAVVLVVLVAVFTITLEAPPATLILGGLFMAIGYGLSRVITVAWKSNSDTAFHEMGDYELLIFESAVHQVILGRKEHSDD